MILSAQTIRKLRPLEPFVERTEVEISGYKFTYGLGPAGYDVRCAERLRLHRNCTVLASTMERFTMPLRCMAIVHDKSSWARRGVAVQNTVIEPGWCGYLTLELSLSPLYHEAGFMYIEAGTPIAQIVFHELDAPTELPYTGKYQDQPRGAQPAK